MLLCTYSLNQSLLCLCFQESNQLHAVCLDTYPPILYMTDTSHQIIRLVHQYNNINEDVKVGFTIIVFWVYGDSYKYTKHFHLNVLLKRLILFSYLSI